MFDLVGTSQRDANLDNLPNKSGTWKDGLSEAEQKFVVWDNHGVDGFNSDTEISPDQVKASQKRAQMTTQRMKKL